MPSFSLYSLICNPAGENNSNSNTNYECTLLHLKQTFLTFLFNFIKVVSSVKIQGKNAIQVY